MRREISRAQQGIDDRGRHLTRRTTRSRGSALRQAVGEARAGICPPGPDAWASDLGEATVGDGIAETFGIGNRLKGPVDVDEARQEGVG